MLLFVMTTTTLLKNLKSRFWGLVFCISDMSVLVIRYSFGFIAVSASGKTNQMKKEKGVIVHCG